MAYFYSGAQTTGGAGVVIARLSGLTFLSTSPGPSFLTGQPHFNGPFTRFRGQKGSARFRPIMATQLEEILPMPVGISNDITGVASSFELDSALLTPLAQITTVYASSFEMDSALLTPTAVLVGGDITGGASAFELDSAFLTPQANLTALAQSFELDSAFLTPTAIIGSPNITGVASSFELDAAFLTPFAQADPAGQSLTPGRLYPLPHGRRVYPVLPAHRRML